MIGQKRKEEKRGEHNLCFIPLKRKGGIQYTVKLLKEKSTCYMYLYINVIPINKKFSILVNLYLNPYSVCEELIFFFKLWEFWCLYHHSMILTLCKTNGYDRNNLIANTRNQYIKRDAEVQNATQTSVMPSNSNNC